MPNPSPHAAQEPLTEAEALKQAREKLRRAKRTGTDFVTLRVEVLEAITVAALAHSESR